MSYLQPPPMPAPVVVVKDVGGYVNDYAAQTEIYRATNREVRLHECRSACTMALSLPNVCVYPDSILKFHQAYDPRDHATNWTVSEQLFETYPRAIQARLGGLTRDYHVLRGAELIDLGVRDCNTPPGPRIIMASATPRPLPETPNAGNPGFASLTGRLEGMMSAFNTAPAAMPGAAPATKKPVPEEWLQTQIPLPPARPAMVAIARPEPGAPAQDPGAPAQDPGAPAQDPGVSPPDLGEGPLPLPPKRPVFEVAYQPDVKPIPFMRRIAGAAPILPTRFVPFEKARG